MQQLTQQLKSGHMELLEVPFPALGKGQVMVRNQYSVISAGTEGKTVADARKGYVAKAKSRQKEVKQVIEMIKTNGLLPTYKLVMNKLEAPAALGYSTAGEVIALGEGIAKLKVGDKVACGGATASHADVVAVPEMLCVKLPKATNLQHAAFTTIAAIAMQGIRQADMRLGESCVIIGMGLLGQLTYKILEASGVYPIGIDISEEQVNAAKKAGVLHVYNRNAAGIEDLVLQHTQGHGADAVIITAGTSSLDPVNFAGEIARKKAKVVIVGAVPTGFDRANYYKKELELIMSSSYGPGRYDSNYEEKGRDYPIGYVRWTENRNMQSFIDMLASGKLDISGLITHTFPLEEAEKAYNLIHDETEPFTGILIQYDTEKELKKSVILDHKTLAEKEVNAGLIGAGSFAQNVLLPQMKAQCNFMGIATAKGNTARYVADKYGFSYCASSAEEIMQDEKINTVFVLTRHDTHGAYVLEAIKNKKHVFVEKPLAMNEEELEQVKTAYEKAGTGQLMVGFNRRFAPAIQKIKALFTNEQAKSIQMRINAGQLPADHWVNDPEVGGGRIIGEACHFVDLAMYLAGAPITSVSADAMEDANGLYNTTVINLAFSNGSVASISYFSNGSKKLPKEQIEVFCGGTVAQMDDFKALSIYKDKVKNIKFKGQDKGHKEEIRQFFKSITEGLPCPIPFNESYLSTLATFKVLQSIRERRRVIL
jgi:polar amino acid transport system substrate-binding protein